MGVVATLALYLRLQLLAAAASPGFPLARRFRAFGVAAWCLTHVRLFRHQLVRRCLRGWFQLVRKLDNHLFNDYFYYTGSQL